MVNPHHCKLRPHITCSNVDTSQLPMMMSEYNLVDKLFLTFLLAIWVCRSPLTAVLQRRYIKHSESYLIFTKSVLVSHGASNCERSKNRFSFLIIFFSENHSFLEINTALSCDVSGNSFRQVYGTRAVARLFRMYMYIVQRSLLEANEVVYVKSKRCWWLGFG